MVENNPALKVKNLLRIGLLLLLVMANQACLSTAQTTPAPMLNQSAFGDSEIQRGMNLGNALDAPAPGEWGVTIQPAYFKAIRDAGFDTVRIPVRFSAYTDAQPPYPIEEDFMQLVDTAVRQALSQGLIVILDLHHYEEIMQDPLGQRERFLALWDQIALHFQDFSPNLYFEILNEPNHALDAITWNVLLEDCIRVIRESNPQRKLLVGSVDYNDIDSLEKLTLPQDENLMAVVHFYLPFEFTHQGADWVDGSERWIGRTWEGTAVEKVMITHQLDRAVAWSERRNVPLVVTEFGSIRGADAASRQRCTAFFAQETEKRNLGWVYWEFCSEFGVYNCEQNEWDESMLEALIDR
jgi:endoglucanase